MILQVLMPLLIVFLGFTAFSGERESGTLRQVMSMGVSRSTLLWGKAVGLGSAVLLVVVPCLVIGGLVLAATGLETVGEGIGTRIVLMGVAYLLYAATFLFLTLAVSAWAKTARAALMVMVGFWAMTAFIMPKAAAELSKVAHPSPPFGTFIAELKEHQKRGIDGVSPFAKLGRYQGETLRKYNVSRVEDLPVYWTAMRMQKLEEVDQPVFDQHYGTVRDTYVAQRRLQDQLGLVAPTLPLRSISMALAGTDLVVQTKFMADAENFRHDMVFKMNDYLSRAAANLNGRNSASNFMIANEDVFAIVPPFRYEPPALGATIREQIGNLGLLGLWLAVAVGLAWAAANRMPLEKT
jgi:ABC-2 type transport system permease protein